MISVRTLHERWRQKEIQLNALAQRDLNDIFESDFVYVTGLFSRHGRFLSSLQQNSRYQLPAIPIQHSRPHFGSVNTPVFMTSRRPFPRLVVRWDFLADIAHRRQALRVL